MLVATIVVDWRLESYLPSFRYIPHLASSFFPQTSFNSAEMAPRGRRTKAGWTRMDGALDAMRPMGFPDKAVRKSVRKLLKVYGDDGWKFIEEAAYTLLIDTILEEPEEDEQEHAYGLPALQAGSIEQPAEHEEPSRALKVHDMILEEPEEDEQEHANELLALEAGSIKQPAGHEEPSRALEAHGSGINCQDVKLGAVIAEAQDLGSEDVKDHKEMGIEVGLAPAYNPQALDKVPVDDKCRPCFGWISDDEEDEIVEVTESGSQSTRLAA